MWNPVQDIRQDFRICTTVWGKGAVLVFYCYIWALIVTNLYRALVDPDAFGWDCVVDEADEISTAWLDGFMAMYCYMMAVWGLYVAHRRISIVNLVVFLLVVAGWYTIGLGLLSNPIKVASPEVGAECMHDLLGQLPLYAIPPALTLMGLVIENCATFTIHEQEGYEGYYEEYEEYCEEPARTV